MITIPRTQWEELPGIQQPITLREFRGVNRLDPFSIGDEFASDIKNLSSIDYPALSTRPGFSLLGAPIGSKVLGIGIWKDIELHAVFSDGTWRKWTGSAWTQLASGLNTSASWTFTNYKGNLSDINLFGSNGVDNIKQYNGSSVSNLSGAPTGGNFITHYQDRLWCSAGNMLHACALGQPTQWQLFNGDDADSYYKEVESPAGEQITAVKSGLSKMTIGMPNSIHMLFGGVPSEFATKPTTFDTGIINNFSADTLDGIMMLMDTKGIYQFAGGTLPDGSFSIPVQDYFSAPVCVGVLDQKVYAAFNNLILEYDAQFQTWHVWRDIQATCFARMGQDMYVGDALGRVLKLGGTTDAGAAINWHWVSKPFTSQSMAQQLRWYKMYLVVDLPVGSSLQIHLSASKSGDADWTLVQSVDSNGLKAARVMIPVTTAALANWIRVKISGSGPVKIHEFTRQQRQLPI